MLDILAQSHWKCKCSSERAAGPGVGFLYPQSPARSLPALSTADSMSMAVTVDELAEAEFEFVQEALPAGF